MALIGLLYFFRVTPLAAPQRPMPQQSMLYLPPKQAAVRDLLSALQDRYPSAILASPDHGHAADADAMASLIPQWTPSWLQAAPAIKPFLLAKAAFDLPSIMGFGQPVLPPLPSTPLPPLVAELWRKQSVSESLPQLPSPCISPRTELLGRKIVKQPTWPDNMFDDSWPANATVPFMVGINADGVVIYCWPEAPRAGIDHEAIRTRLLAMRFSPGSGPLQWWQFDVQL